MKKKGSQSHELMRSFDLNRWKCEFGVADELLSEGKGEVWEMTKREINV